MMVEQYMTRDVESCSPQADLSNAAMIMWRRDCGFVPVVEVSSGRLAGVITDRDICMATATKHQPPDQISVGDVMSRQVWTCGPSDDVRVAMHRMGEAQVRRLPVVDKQGRLEGVISLNDVALAAERTSRKVNGTVGYDDVMGVVKSVAAHRLPMKTIEVV